MSERKAKTLRRQDRGAENTQDQVLISVSCVGTSSEQPAHVSSGIVYSGEISAVAVTSKRLE